MPRVTMEQITDLVVDEKYHVFPGTTLTVCCLTLKNGTHVTGESATVMPSNFDEKKGKEISKRRAIDKVWSLEGYLLKEKIHTGEITLPADKGGS